MKIYLDYIFFENVIINFLLIFNVSIFTKSKPKLFNKIIAVVILSFYTTLTYVLNDSIVSNIVVKILVMAIAVYIAYIPKTIIEYIKKQVYFFIVYFSFVGIIISITLFLNISIEKEYVKVVIYSVSSLILYIFNKYLWKMWKTNIKFHDLTYTLCIGGQEIQAFVDTGNTVKDYVNNLDVIFLDSSYFINLKQENVLTNKVEIEYNTATSKSISTGYIIENIKVLKDKEYISNIQKIVIAFIPEAINKKEYSALIGYNTYIENLKGVSLC